MAAFPQDMAIEGDKAYIVESGNWGPGHTGTEGLVQVDLFTKQTHKFLIDNLDNPWSVDLDGQTAYVTGNLSNNLVIYDLGTSTAQFIDLPTQCIPVGVKYASGKIYVACSGYDLDTYTYADPGLVAVVDPAKSTVTTIPTSQINPGHLALSNAGDALYVVCTGDYAARTGVIDKIDLATGQVVANIPIGSSPGLIAIAANGKAFIADNMSGSLLTFDTATNAIGDPVEFAGAFWVASVSVNPMTGKVFAGEWTNNKIWIVDPDDQSILGSADASNVSGISFWE